MRIGPAIKKGGRDVLVIGAAQSDLTPLLRRPRTHTIIKPGQLAHVAHHAIETGRDGKLFRVLVLNGPADGKGWFTITNSADRATVHLFGVIGSRDASTGVNAAAFINELNQIPRAQQIDLRIHSPGGYVWDALPIYNYLRARRDSVTAHIDGLAASCASFIAMAAGKITMPKTARMMIHDAQGNPEGNAKACRDAADVLERETNNIADAYAEKTGKPRAQILKMMAATTWMTGDEAKAMGFCDEVTNGAVLNCAEFDLTCFQHVPEALVTNQTQNPMKEQIIAMLRKHGITVSNTATDAELGTLLAQLENKLNESKPADLTAVLNEIKNLKGQLPAPAPTPTPTPAPTNVVTVNADEWRRMQNTIEGERTKRITNELNAIIAEGRPYINAKTALPRALADESFLAELRTGPVTPTGAEPVRNIIINCGNPLVEAYAKLKHGKERNEFRISNHLELLKQFSLIEPKNANSYSATLVTDYLADALVVTSNNKLAMLNTFTRNFSVDPVKPRATIDIRKSTPKNGEGVQTNSTNFEQGDSQIDAVQISVSQVTRAFNVTNDEINKGHQLAYVAEANAQIFVNGITDIVTALLIAANFANPIVIGAAANFDQDDMKPILSAAKNFRAKNLILDGGHLAYLLPTNTIAFQLGQKGAYGFDLINENNRWTNAVANCVGVVCSPQCIGVAAGSPVDLPPGEMLEERSLTLDNGLTVKMYMWFSRGGRVRWASYDVMFGAAKLDGNEARLLVTA